MKIFWENQKQNHNKIPLHIIQIFSPQNLQLRHLRILSISKDIDQQEFSYTGASWEYKLVKLF